MKHKLNLNESGSRVISIALILLVISLLLFGFAWVLKHFGLQAVWFHNLAGFLLGLGVFLLLVLFVLLMVEARQDRAMDVSYRKQRNRRLPAGNGYYECQFCGSRRVQEKDRVCPACGRELMV